MTSRYLVEFWFRRKPILDVDALPCFRRPENNNLVEGEDCNTCSNARALEVGFLNTLF